MYTFQHPVGDIGGDFQRFGADGHFGERGDAGQEGAGIGHHGFGDADLGVDAALALKLALLDDGVDGEMLVVQFLDCDGAHGAVERPPEGLHRRGPHRGGPLPVLRHGLPPEGRRKGPRPLNAALRALGGPPRGQPEGYFAQWGWTAADSRTRVPDNDTDWNETGGPLTPEEEAWADAVLGHRPSKGD